MHLIDVIVVNETVKIHSETFQLNNRIRKALKAYDLDDFTLILDTYESTLEDDKDIEKVNKFRIYILGYWEYVQDWRKRISIGKVS